MKSLSLIIFICLLTAALFAQTSFEQLNGPCGGSILSLCTTPNGSLIAGSKSGGVYRSTDEGVTWKYQDRAPSAPTGSVIVVAATSHGTVFALSGTFGWTTSLYRSTDVGKTWQRYPNLDSLDCLSGFICIPRSGQTDRILLAADTGIISSTDEGVTWERFITPGSRYSFMSFLSSEGSTIAAIEARGFLISENGGLHWTLRNNGIPGFNVALRCGTRHPNGDYFVATYGNIYRSTDKGLHWINCTNGMPGIVIKTLVADERGTIYAGVESGGLFRSTDLGASWQPMNTGLHKDATVFAVCVLRGSSGKRIVLGTDVRGIARSTNAGESWTPTNTGFVQTFVSALTTNRDNNLYAGTLQGGIFRSSDRGHSFTQVVEESTASGIHSLAYDAVTNRLYAGTVFGIFHSTDGGTMWRQKNRGIPQGFWPASFAFKHAGNADLIFTGGNDAIILRSSDGGDNWTQLNTGMIGYAVTRSLLVARDGSIYAGTEGDGIFRSIDNGDTWNQVLAVKPNSGGTFRLLEISNGTVFATRDILLYRSADGGAHWSTDSLPTINYPELFLQNERGKFFVSNGFSFYSTIDDGKTWDYFSNFSGAVESACIDRDGYLYIGTAYGGIYRSSVSTRVPSSEGLPHAFRIVTNYPNPFSDETAIVISTATRSFVRLSVHDVLGREVARPFEGICGIGEMEYRWNSRSMPSGVYLCRMTDGKYVVNRLMNLNR